MAGREFGSEFEKDENCTKLLSGKDVTSPEWWTVDEATPTPYGGDDDALKVEPDRLPPLAQPPNEPGNPLLATPPCCCCTAVTPCGGDATIIMSICGCSVVGIGGGELMLMAPGVVGANAVAGNEADGTEKVKLPVLGEPLARLWGYGAVHTVPPLGLMLPCSRGEAIPPSRAYDVGEAAANIANDDDDCC